MEFLTNALSGFWSYGIVFIAVLTLVVFIHELGHFLVARWCGVDVKAFSIGFGPEIFGFNDRHGTRWRFAWIPLGGYVKFMDDDNAASKPSPDALARMSPDERKGSFHAKPVWQRAAVVAAGPAANFLLAIVLYFVINAAIGVRSTPPRIDHITANSPAAAAGLQPGDVITAINGWSVDSFEDVLRQVNGNADRQLVVTVKRDDRIVDVPVTPRGKDVLDGFGGQYRAGDLGIASYTPAIVGGVVPGKPAEKAGFKPGDVVVAIDGQPIKWFEDLVRIVGASDGRTLTFTLSRDGQTLDRPVTTTTLEALDKSGKPTGEKRAIIGVSRIAPEPRPAGLAESMKLAVWETWTNITATVSGIGDIISRRQSADQMGGPILMAEVTAKVAELGIEPMLRWIAFISANIGFLNLLPIPVLDGGHLMFYAIEAVRRKPLNERMQEVGFQIGIALVMMLMIYVNLNDLMRVWKRFVGAD